MAKNEEGFLVIDTEGSPNLYEVAVCNEEGEIIYNINYRLQNESKKSFLNLLLKNSHKKIVCHNASHEKKVIKNLFKEFNKEQDFSKLTFQCTYKLSKKHLPFQKSYSLIDLAQNLSLKVEGKTVNADFTHKAKYDVLITYELYKKILEKIMIEKLKEKPNPFSSSRVDNPFQLFPDDMNIYKKEYEKLKNILLDIKKDPNSQSRGAVILAKAGNGKTHIIMRLSKEILKNNRLLFIRQPNDPQTVKYHIYQRILESLFEKIPDTKYTQLEYLLARTLSKIIIKKMQYKSNSTKEKLKEILDQNPLNLFEKLGKEGTKTKRAYWKYIEKIALEYWEERFGIGGFSPIFLRGLIRYSSYSDPNKKEIIKRWLSAMEIDEERLKEVELESFQDMSKEEFGLEAIITLGKLSLQDEPLILAFDQLEGLKYNEELTIAFMQSLKEIFTHLKNSLIICNFFPDRWENLENRYDRSVIDRLGQTQIYLKRPSNEEILQILNLRLKEAQIKEDFFDQEEINFILKSSSIREAINRAYKVYEKKVFNIDFFDYETSNEERDLYKDILEIKNSLKLILSHLKIESPKRELTKDIDKYFKKIETFFLTNYEKSIFSAEDDLGKFRKMVNLYKIKKNLKIKESFLQYGRRKLPINTVLNETAVIFLYESGQSLTARAKNIIELALYEKNKEFYIIRDSRCNINTGKKGKMVLASIQNAKNIKYLEIGKSKRAIFDTIDKIIDDIHNKDVSFTQKDFLQFLHEKSSLLWIISIIEKILVK